MDLEAFLEQWKPCVLENREESPVQPSSYHSCALSLFEFLLTKCFHLTHYLVSLQPCIQHVQMHIVDSL